MNRRFLLFIRYDWRMFLRVFVFGLALLAGGAVNAELATVAVAANFAKPARALADRFEAQTGHEIRLSLGATGALYAQIKNGAPFDVLMAADALRPQLLVEEGAAIKGSQFTYAVGRLVLWSARIDVADGPAVLRAGEFRKIAIANPDIAPYGLAAMQTMAKLGVTEQMPGKLVQGANIGQAHAMVGTGNAALGFVARSYLEESEAATGWIVPADMHDPIEQDAVLLKRGADNKAARTFMEYLKGEEAQAFIRNAGYDTPLL